MENQNTDKGTKWMLYTARIIALLWAGFWMFFGIASGIGEGLRLTGILMHVLLPGLVFLGIALLAWRWETHGAILFMTIGLIVLIAYPILFGGKFPLSTIIFVDLTMALPPLVAGALLFVAVRKAKAAGLSPLDDEG